MKVTVLEHTPTRMVVRTGPWWGWWIWVSRLLALALALFGSLVVVGSIDRATLVCDPAGGGTCILTRRTLFGTERREIALRTLGGAALRADQPDGNSGVAVLIAGDEEIPFTTYTGGEASEMQAVIERIDGWIRAPDEQRLDVSFDHTLTGAILGGLILVLAAFAAWWGVVTTCMFDLDSNQLLVRRDTLVSWTRDRRLDTLKEVEVRSRKRLINRAYPMYHEVRLVFEDGRHITVDGTDDSAAASSLARRIRAFLQRRPSDSAADAGDEDLLLNEPA